MVKHKILWESLKETADLFAAKEGFDDLKWSLLLKMMKDSEETLESLDLSNGTALSTIVDALEFGFACWGVIALVMSVIA